MYAKAEIKHHVETFGPHTSLGTKILLKAVQAEKYDPGRLAQLFKKQAHVMSFQCPNSRTVLPCTIRHIRHWTLLRWSQARTSSGFLLQLYVSTSSLWGIQSSREHWWFMNGGMQFDSDVQDEHLSRFFMGQPNRSEELGNEPGNSRVWDPKPDEAYLTDWLMRNCEIVDNTSHKLYGSTGGLSKTCSPLISKNSPAITIIAAYSGIVGVAINYKHTHSRMALPYTIFELANSQASLPFLANGHRCRQKFVGATFRIRNYKTADDLVDDSG